MYKNREIVINDDDSVNFYLFFFLNAKKNVLVLSNSKIEDKKLFKFVHIWFLNIKHNNLIQLFKSN